MRLKYSMYISSDAWHTFEGGQKMIAVNQRFYVTPDADRI
jgi:hypothetical protein